MLSLGCEIKTAVETQTCTMSGSARGMAADRQIGVPATSVEWKEISMTITGGQALLSLPTAPPGEYRGSTDNGSSEASSSEATKRYGSGIRGMLALVAGTFLLL